MIIPGVSFKPFLMPLRLWTRMPINRPGNTDKPLWCWYEGNDSCLFMACLCCQFDWIQNHLGDSGCVLGVFQRCSIEEGRATLSVVPLPLGLEGKKVSWAQHWSSSTSCRGRYMTSCLTLWLPCLASLGGLYLFKLWPKINSPFLKLHLPGHSK